MLSSRYLHLHEALELGPMWLNRQARVLPPDAPPQIERVRPIAAAVQRAAAVAEPYGNKPRIHVPSAQKMPPQTDVPAQTKTVQTAQTVTAPPLQIAAAVPSEIMIISVCPSPDDRTNGQLFSSGSGILLDNMLAAIGLNGNQAHKSCWVKAAPLFAALPEADELERALPELQQELQQAAPKAVVLLGNTFRQPPFADAAARLCNHIPCFIMPHPAHLLRQPQLKAQAWTELKKLKAVLREAGTV